MYIPRNPHAPSSGTAASSTKLSICFDQFNLWERDHPVVHQDGCSHPTHLHVYILNMCCVDAIKARADWCLLIMAGSKLSLWPQSHWITLWFDLAMIRLSELESGQNFADIWEGNLENYLWRGR